MLYMRFSVVKYHKFYKRSTIPSNYFDFEFVLFIVFVNLVIDDELVIFEEIGKR